MLLSKLILLANVHVNVALGLALIYEQVLKVLNHSSILVKH
jgi:hypothetical protein